MDSHDRQNVDTTAISTQPTGTKERKVSMASDISRDIRLGFENAGFDPYPRRKVSQNSDDIGQVRKKSILVNSQPSPVNTLQLSGAHDIDSAHSHITGSIHDKRNGESRIRNYVNQQEMLTRQQKIARQEREDRLQIEQSWIYALCMRCRVEYNTPSWEPPHWQKVCPYPLCPSFRQFANIISIILIGVFIWVAVYVILGETAAPGGQLFGLVVLAVAANLGGWVISLTTLPRLIGMLLVGILFQNVGWVDIDGEFTEVVIQLRKIALTIILIRAGLEMDPEAFKKIYWTILKLSLIPWTVECCVIAVMSYYLLSLPWIYAFALGAIMAAVSPAVVVPCLFRLRTKGYGVAKGIPTLIIAVAGIDDAASVAIFGIIASILFGEGSLAYQIAQAPVCIFGGLAFGVVFGLLARFIPEKGDSYVIPIRTLLLFGGGLLAMYGSEEVGFEGAGPLGVVFAAFVSNYFWCQQGWEVEDNPVGTAFEIFWMIFEPILFGVTGAAIKISEMNGNIVVIAIACIAAGVILRILATILIAFGDKLNVKEKIFVSLSWMAKATVQAALGPVVLKRLGEHPTEEEQDYGEKILMVCIMSIVLTAPLGALLISVSGTKLLTKTKQLHHIEGWRRSHRPSLYDISIINEEEERAGDAEVATTNNKTANGSKSHHNQPAYTVTK